MYPWRRGIRSVSGIGSGSARSAKENLRARSMERNRIDSKLSSYPGVCVDIYSDIQIQTSLGILDIPFKGSVYNFKSEIFDLLIIADACVTN